MSKLKLVGNDPWAGLKKYTDARIALGHAGVSLPTEHHLKFQWDHAAARDAVNREIDWVSLQSELLESFDSILLLQSRVGSRSEYLQRPDLGRLLNESSINELQKEKSENTVNSGDVVIVITDGLSAPAIEQSAVGMVKCLLDNFGDLGLSCSTICCVKYGRVAVGDKVAEALNSKHCIVLVGERPGLSSPNSLGIYYTFAARKNSTDADRNCISNVRDGGQDIATAAKRLCWLISEADRRGLSGVELKDDSQNSSLVSENANFLLPSR